METFFTPLSLEVFLQHDAVHHPDLPSNIDSARYISWFNGTDARSQKPSPRKTRSSAWTLIKSTTVLDPAPTTRAFGNCTEVELALLNKLGVNFASSISLSI